MTPTLAAITNSLSRCISNIDPDEDGGNWPLIAALWTAFLVEIESKESLFDEPTLRPVVASLTTGVGFCLGASKYDPVTNEDVTLNELLQASAYVEIALAQLTL